MNPFSFVGDTKKRSVNSKCNTQLVTVFSSYAIFLYKKEPSFIKSLSRICVKPTKNLNTYFVQINNTCVITYI